MYRRLLLLACVAALSTAPARAAKTQLVTRNGFTVEFRGSVNSADQVVAGELIDAFLVSYPRLVADFNSAAPRRVISAAYWLDRNGYRGVVRKADARLRREPYSPKISRQLTGRGTEESWAVARKGGEPMNREYDGGFCRAECRDSRAEMNV